MNRFIIASAVLAVLLVLQVPGYFPVSKVLPLDRYRNLDYYPNYMPACTLNLDLNSHGASGFMDVHFSAPSGGFKTTDSLEIYSVLCLPREFSIDSMVLWVEGEPQPAKLISIGQAEATYNSIVYVTRKDPAYIRRIRGYPDNYGYYPYRPYENQFELKIFPCFPGGGRQVRIFLDCHGDMAASFNRYNLGYPMNTVIRVNTQKSSGRVPSVSAGTLSIFSNQDKLGYQIAEVGTHDLTLTLAAPLPVNRGCNGIVQTAGADMNFFKLQIDLNRMFELDTAGKNRKVTFVWVPSSAKNTGATNLYEEEKELLSDYIAGFKPQERLNIVYAGSHVEMFEPHMVDANAGALLRANDFLSSRVNPELPSLYHKSFRALVDAFGSIAAADTPAIVFCMDRESLPANGQPLNYARIDSMKNVLLQINVNKTQFYAWVHWSKAFFYNQIAYALKGNLTFYDPFYTYRHAYTMTAQYDFTLIDRFFNPLPVVNGFRIDFDAGYADIIASRQKSGYETPGSVPCGRIDLLGRCRSNFLAGTVTATINHQSYSSPFQVTGQGAAATGLNLNKLWAFDMTEVFADERNFSYWAPKRDYALSGPSPEFAGLQGTILNNPATYRKMVDISLANRVATGATALLALEPGMELLDEDRFRNSGGIEVSAAIEDRTGKNNPPRKSFAAFPNPFNPNTVISLESNRLKGWVVLHIYGPDGRLVRTLKAQAFDGRARWSFNGRDMRGAPLAGGVYVARAVCGQQTWRMKLLFMK